MILDAEDKRKNKIKKAVVKEKKYFFDEYLEGWGQIILENIQQCITGEISFVYQE